MLLVIFIWILIFFNSFNFGYLFFNQNQVKVPITLIVILGLCIQILVCTFLYFLIPINYYLLPYFFILSLIIFLIKFKNIKSKFKNTSKITYWKIIFLFVVFIYSIILSSYPIPFYDELLYYHDTISWIQKYPIVKGLANLHFRMGFMSSWHFVVALYEFPISTNTSDTIISFNYTLNGFCYFLFAIYLLEASHYFSKKTYQILLLSFLFFNLIVLANFISSASPDLVGGFFMIILFSIFLEYEQGNDNTSIFLMTLLIVTIIIIKITNSYIVLIAIFFLKKEKLKKLFFSFSFFMVAILLFLIKNIYLTGYLFFPFKSFGGLGVDWQVSQGMNIGYFFWYYRFASKDNWIEMLYTRFLIYNPYWTIINYSLVILFMIEILFYVFFRKFLFLSISNKSTIQQFFNTHKITLATLCIFIGIHFFILPSITTTYVIRFAFGIIIWFNAILIYLFTQKFKPKILIYILTMLVIFNMANFFRYAQRDILFESFVYPQPLLVKDLQIGKYTQNAQTFFYPLNDTYSCGNYFPCIHNKNFNMRGNSLKDGFRQKE